MQCMCKQITMMRGERGAKYWMRKRNGAQRTSDINDFQSRRRGLFQPKTDSEQGVWGQAMSNEAQGADRHDAKLFGNVNMSNQPQRTKQPKMAIQINHSNSNHMVVPFTIRYATFSRHAHTNISLSSRFPTSFTPAIDNARIPDKHRKINRMDKWVREIPTHILLETRLC